VIAPVTNRQITYTIPAAAMEPSVARFLLFAADCIKPKDTHTARAMTAVDNSALEDTLIKLILIFVFLIFLQLHQKEFLRIWVYVHLKYGFLHVQDQLLKNHH